MNYVALPDGGIAWGPDLESSKIRTFRFIRFTKRHYDAMALVACRAEIAPSGQYGATSADWTPCDDSILFGLTRFEICHQSGRTVEYWGYL